MQLVDAHCHLDSEELAPGLEDHLRAAREVGVVRLVTATVEPSAFRPASALASRFEEVELALGVHPWYLRPEHLGALAELEEARGLGAIAIGEIGLDRKTERSPFELQLEAFGRQLAVARELDLPVVVHCRGAFGELRDCCRRVGLPRAGGLVHAFGGSVEVVRELRPLGFVFSLGGALTFRNSRKRVAVLEEVWPEALLLETDAPDLPPVEVRAEGGPNLPANIVHNLRAAAGLLGRSEEEVAEATTANALRLFGLGAS